MWHDSRHQNLLMQTEFTFQIIVEIMSIWFRSFATEFINLQFKNLNFEIFLEVLQLTFKCSLV